MNYEAFFKLTYGLYIVSTKINDKLNDANWGSVAGNDVEIIYFAGVDPRNPSGSTDNIDTINYRTGGITQWSKQVTYNSADNITLVERV